MPGRKLKNRPQLPKLAVVARKRRRKITPHTPSFADFSPVSGKTTLCPSKGTKSCVASLQFIPGQKHPVIRFCDKAGTQGTKIEVRTVDEALRLTDSMCECMKKPKGSAKSCVTKIGRKAKPKNTRTKRRRKR